MSRLRVHQFSLSLDGYGAGTDQSAAAPLGVGGPSLHEWIFATRAGQEMLGLEGGERGVNDAIVRSRTIGVGATIMGRNMFGPVRGPWPDDAWRGWWGEEPPFGHEVFVLTHHTRADLAMANGTVFHFLDATPAEALGRAAEAAGGRDVVLGGGVSTIRAFLEAGLVDDLQLVIVPVLLGAGERLFGDSSAAAGYRCAGISCSGGVVHVQLTREPAS